MAAAESSEPRSLGELIRQTRRMRRLSQEDVGEVFGVHQSTVAKWERGDRLDPERMPELAKFLGRTVPEVTAIAYGFTQDDVMDRLDALQATLNQVLSELAVQRGMLRSAGLDDGKVDGRPVPDGPVAEIHPATRPRRRLARSE